MTGKTDKLKKMWEGFKKRVKELKGRFLAAPKSSLRLSETPAKSSSIMKESIRQKRVIAAYVLFVAVVFAGVYFGQNKKTGINPNQEGTNLTDMAGNEAAEVTILPDAYTEENLNEAGSVGGQAKNQENLIWPVNGEIVAGFHDIYNIDNQYRLHHGIDLKADLKTGIKAVLSGQVEETKVDPVIGNTVILSHDGQMKTIYGNLGVIKVKAGEEVNQGQVIAYTGDSAKLDLSQGNFLHFGVEEEGQYRDPLEFLP